MCQKCEGNSKMVSFENQIKGGISIDTDSEPLEYVKFVFSKKATKIDEIFTVNLTLCSRRQINGEDIINFCGLQLKNMNFRKGLCYKCRQKK